LPIIAYATLAVVGLMLLLRRHIAAA